jgi:hypothetical protein
MLEQQIAGEARSVRADAEAGARLNGLLVEG